VLLCAGWITASAAFAGDADQLWPELGLFVTLSPGTRLFFDAPYTKEMVTNQQSLEAAWYLDVSLKPIWRKDLQQDDWARNRYFWMRIGYDHIFDVSNGARTTAEERAILELRARAALPRKAGLDGRVRVDFRWIGGDYSTRYRARLEVNREFMVKSHPVVPYFNAEWFYDTRYDGWARILYQAGAEVAAGKHFRYEIYLARQNDRLPSSSSTNALGVFLKWFF
jgi:hypothetical protein